jgi:hypothetical protein
LCVVDVAHKIRKAEMEKRSKNYIKRRRRRRRRRIFFLSNQQSECSVFHELMCWLSLTFIPVIPSRGSAVPWGTANTS